MLADDPPITSTSARVVDSLTSCYYGSNIYASVHRAAQKKGALTIGNKVDYIDNAEQGYCRVIKKKVVKILGKEVCTATHPNAFKKISYKNKPDDLDKILLRDANPYAPLAVPDIPCASDVPVSLDAEGSAKVDVSDSVDMGRKKKSKIVRFQADKVPSDDSSDSREFLSETRVLDAPSRKFSGRDIDIRFKIFKF